MSTSLAGWSLPQRSGDQTPSWTTTATYPSTRSTVIGQSVTGPKILQKTKMLCESKRDVCVFLFFNWKFRWINWKFSRDNELSFKISGNGSHGYIFPSDLVGRGSWGPRQYFTNYLEVLVWVHNVLQVSLSEMNPLDCVYILYICIYMYVCVSMYAYIKYIYILFFIFLQHVYFMFGWSPESFGGWMTIIYLLCIMYRYTYLCLNIYLYIYSIYLLVLIQLQISLCIHWLVHMYI